MGRRHWVLVQTSASWARLAEGLYHMRLELQVMIDEGDRERLSVAQTLLHIATVKRRYGLASGAVIRRMLHVCIWVYDASDYPIGKAEAYSELGVLCRTEGRYAEAIDLHGRAVAIAEGSGDRRFEAIFLNDYGATV